MLALMWGLKLVCVWPVVEPEGWKLDPATNMFKVGHQACVLLVQRNIVYSLAYGCKLPTPSTSGLLAIVYAAVYLHQIHEKQRIITV